MNNKRTKSKTALLGGIVAISLLAPRAHAQIIFFDDFSEDTTSTYTAGLPGTYNNLTVNAPAGAPTNKLDWTSTPALGSPYAYQYGAGNVSTGTVGYATGTTATNGSDYEVYLAPGDNGTGRSNDPSDLTTPILTSTGAAVDLVAGATYTLSLDVGFRTDQTMSTLGIDLLAGTTVVDADTSGFTDEVTPTSSQQSSGIFKNYSFTITAPLMGDSGALSLEFVNLADQSQVDLSNIELSETPEPGTWAMLLGGLGVLFSFQRLRRGFKV